MFLHFLNIDFKIISFYSPHPNVEYNSYKHDKSRGEHESPPEAHGVVEEAVGGLPTFLLPEDAGGVDDSSVDHWSGQHGEQGKENHVECHGQGFISKLKQ